jgi:hypothetical protein
LSHDEEKGMKTFLIAICLLLSAPATAETESSEWQSTSLTESTIKKIQSGKLEYKKCITEALKKPAYLEGDSRKATADIIKLCEPALSKMRETYISEKVPGEIADRHLRQLRIQMTRSALQELIFTQASRNAE